VTARYRAIAVMVVVLGVVSSCGDTKERMITVEGYPPVAASDLDDALGALCDVRAEADRDVAAARTTFANRSHQALHIVAGAVERTDRRRSGTLLVAKQRVEADFAAEPTPDTLGSDVDALIASVADAAPVVDLEPPSCAR
jgi:hypothetical protein